MNGKIKNQEVIQSVCEIESNMTFFDKVVERGFLNNPVCIASILADNKIGNNAIEVLENWDGNEESKSQMERLIEKLPFCEDIDFNDYLHSIFFYLRNQDEVSTTSIESMVSNIFTKTYSSEKQSTTPIFNNLQEEDLENYDEFLGYIFNNFSVKFYEAYMLLDMMKYFPNFKNELEEENINIQVLQEEMLYLFNNYIDFSYENNQSLFYELLNYTVSSADCNLNNYIEVISSALEITDYLYNEECYRLLEGCHSKIIDAKEHGEDVLEAYSNFIELVSLVNINNDIDSKDRTKNFKLLNIETHEEMKRQNEARVISDYSKLVLDLIKEKYFPITEQDLIELICSTKNIFYIDSCINTFHESAHKILEEYNNMFANSIIDTDNDEYILEQYKKGIINFDYFITIIYRKQNLSTEEILEKIEEDTSRLDEYQKALLISRLDDKELIKMYIEKVDFRPKRMNMLFRALGDDTYIMEFLENTKNVDIHLRYLLLSQLKDKTLLKELEKKIISIRSLDEIDIETLLNSEECEYIQIHDSDRDVNDIIGTYEIIKKEEFVEILKKANELLEGIPYSGNEDLIEDSIILKKVYERYVRNTLYDDEAVLDENENDWKRQVRCRSFGGGILDGLAVCSGDAFCLKNLLGMRGIKAYATRGASRNYEAGHAWNTIKLGENYYKFDGTAERNNTIKTGALSLHSIKKEHSEKDDYKDEYDINQSHYIKLDEMHNTKKRHVVPVEFDD